MTHPPRPDAARPPRPSWEQGLPPDNAPPVPAPLRDRDRRSGVAAVVMAVSVLVIVALIVLL